MPATALVLTLVTQLVRSKLLGSAEVDAMAVALEHDGDVEAAMMLRGAYLEAMEEPAHVTGPKLARASFRVIPNDE